MPYRVVVIDADALHPRREWVEPNKDEVISVLHMLLVEHEYDVTITFPDGSTIG